MSSQIRRFKIKVPASSANIGPGFDVLGIGLQLYLTLDVTIDPSRSSNSDPNNVVLKYEGDLAENVPLQSDKNLVTSSALYVLRCNGFTQFPNGTFIDVTNPVPLGRGLGSSASAIVAGVCLGNEIAQLGMDKIRMLDYCLMIERHPDNIAAAMLGGFVGSYLNELPIEEHDANLPLEYILPRSSTPVDKIVNSPPPKNIGEYMSYDWCKSIKCVCIIPNFEVSTDKSRAVLPESYTRPDIVYNLQRIAILTTALTQTPPNEKLIYQAMKDKIHQPYRSGLIPGLPEVLQSVTPESHPGLCGICLSGAGPTILCLATKNYDEIAKTVVDIFKRDGVECDWKVLDLAYDGATVEQIV
ncbi:homoserine kinase [Spathaspora passalidarum NRRL Y-27907]|uniref:Homoserine kinase n=1 Tax=Spathaspora passalidarum (strain NRRL Y-27907 / 11-Y1) TaxID=619300 RepID=G3ANS7_SPAPN|nr:homoserine kinase [Spathaspora passalidarum NRRL Y-27907]EGW32012.1 homoserine kinase [Spathaspora passalidarum NRRL Y-27907]